MICEMDLVGGIVLDYTGHYLDRVTDWVASASADMRIRLTIKYIEKLFFKENGFNCWNESGAFLVLDHM